MFVADRAQERLAFGDLRLSFDPLGLEPVDHPQDAAALLGLADHDLHRVGCGAEDAADLGQVLDRVDAVDSSTS